MDVVPHKQSGWLRSFVELLIIVAVLYGLWAIYPHQTHTILSQAYQRFFPCSMPVTYRIGTIDPQFNLTKAQVVTLLQKAADKWNTAAGKSVLSYDQTNGVVVVNFVYDYRQKTTNQLSTIGSTVHSGEAQYDALKAQYSSKKTQYLSDKSAYESALTSFQTKQAAYNQQVQYWNARGGAPAGTYDELQQEKAQLESQSSALQTQQASINAEVDSLNALADQINQLISSLNLNVQKFNTIGASTGSEFEEGLFESSFASESIDIYQYDSGLHLHRVLAHEFGHALGMEHVDDAQAIMNALNSGSEESPNAADIAELDTVCHLKWRDR